MLTRTLFCFLFGSVICFADAFRNFGFEDADLSNVQFNGPGFGLGPVSELMPGWQLTVRSETESIMGYNLVLDGGHIAIQETSKMHYSGAEGRFFLLGIPPVGPDGMRTTFSISQRGEIPVGMNELQFNIAAGAFKLSINGTPVDLVNSGGIATASIGQYSGQNVELSLTTAPHIFGGLRPEWGVDSIRFVPEPSTWALICIASLVTFLRRHSRSARDGGLD